MLNRSGLRRQAVPTGVSSCGAEQGTLALRTAKNLRSPVRSVDLSVTSVLVVTGQKCGRALSGFSRNTYCNFALWPGKNSSCTAKLMPEPTARELAQRAQVARAIAARMHNPHTKRIMTRLALTYDRLAKFVAAHEASGQNIPREQGRDEACLVRENRVRVSQS